MFFHTLNRAEFSFIPALESEWRTVLSEAQELDVGNYLAWPEHDLYGESGWDAFGLYAFGRRMDANCARCPATARLVEAVPGMVTAGFSRLAGGAHIKPHRGFESYAGHYLRCHLGLDIPPGCGLRVGGETREWQAGRCMVFDDSVEHEAWNRSDEARIVLLMDFRNPFRTDTPPQPELTPEVLALLERENLV